MANASRVCDPSECAPSAMVAMPSADGFVVGAVDGAGTGNMAGAASAAFIAALGEGPVNPLEYAMRYGHLALRGHGGAVASIALVQPGTLTWTGVGNVAAKVFRPSGQTDVLRNRSGVLGHRFPILRVATVDFNPGDVVVFAVGIDPAFVVRLSPGVDPRALAQALLARFSSDDDDALVVVATVRPPAALPFPGPRPLPTAG